jgi:hypothetical protein
MNGELGRIWKEAVVLSRHVPGRTEEYLDRRCPAARFHASHLFTKAVQENKTSRQAEVSAVHFRCRTAGHRDYGSDADLTQSL